MSARKPTGSDSTAAGRLFTAQEISEFLFHACHDLRTPLRAIRAHTELFARRESTAGSEPSLGFIVEGTRKLDLLVDALSGYSLALRIDQGAFVPAPLRILVRSVLAKLDKELRDSQVEVICGELPRVSGDPDRLMQLFENLLQNALHRRSETSPQVQITAATHAEGWLFTVRDNGPADDGHEIEAADLEGIFQPFALSHGTNRPGGELSLATCREIVERHGGRIWAEREAGGGCTFRFTLPAEAF